MLTDCFKTNIVFFINFFLFLNFNFLNISANAHELPNIGDPSQTTLSPQQEVELGQEYFAMLSKQLDFESSPYINEYVQNLGNSLVHPEDNPDKFEYKFYVLRDDAINAFAIPGGIVAINTGMILATESESELASVIAHEITHVSQKHACRSIASHNKIMAARLAGILASALISSKNPNAGSAAMAAAIGGSTQAILSFSRKNEQEADSLGMLKVYKSGYDVHSVPSFLQKLQVKFQHKNATMPEYLRTHPLTNSRVTKAKARAMKYAYKQVVSSLDYHIAKSMVEVNKLGANKKTTKHFESKYKNGTFANELEVKHSLALALKNQNEFNKAHSIFEELSFKYPDNYILKLETAKIEQILNKTKIAEKRILSAFIEHPENINVALTYSEALLANKEKESAKTAIKILNKQNPKTPKGEIKKIYALKAKAYSNVGDKFNSFLSEADYLISNQMLFGALKKLELAKKTVKEGTSMHNVALNRIDKLNKIIKVKFPE